jgi:hypothetical protein
VIDGREQLPLWQCPNNCSFAGSCVRAAANASEKAACQCLGAYAVSVAVAPQHVACRVSGLRHMTSCTALLHQMADRKQAL